MAGKGRGQQLRPPSMGRSQDGVGVFYIPKEKVGLIIGKGGKRINEIQVIFLHAARRHPIPNQSHSMSWSATKVALAGPNVLQMCQLDSKSKRKPLIKVLAIFLS